MFFLLKMLLIAAFVSIAFFGGKGLDGDLSFLQGTGLVKVALALLAIFVIYKIFSFISFILILGVAALAVFYAMRGGDLSVVLNKFNFTSDTPKVQKLEDGTELDVEPTDILLDVLKHRKKASKE